MTFRRAAATALILTTGLTLAGCGGKKNVAHIPPARSSAASSTASATATPSSKLGANPEPTGQAQTPASAQAFAKYFIVLIDAAYEDRSMASIWAHANRSTCTSCTYSAKFIRDEVANKYRQTDTAPIKFNRSSIASAANGAWSVNVVTTLPPWRKVGDDGRVRDHGGASPNSQYQIELTWSSGHWMVKNYSIKATK